MRLLLAAWLLALLAPAWAQDLLPVPALTARVIDQTGTLDASQRGALEAKLAAFEQQSGPQIVVLMVPTTAPEDIAAFAHRVADQWKIGRREVGDGLLIVVAKNDRRIRIEVAKALEGAVPDLAARLIIDRSISPAFRAGNFAGGLEAGIDALMARIKGEGLPEPSAARDADAPPWEELAMFFFIAVFVIGSILSRVLGRRLGGMLTAGGAGVAAWALGAGLGVAVVAALLAFIMVGVFGAAQLARQTARRHGGRIGGGLPGGFGGGWGGGGGGFGGGGFGSGGGGDFGGGGASGDW